MGLIMDNKNISFTLPNPYQSEMADIARRQKMAELLEAQALQPLQTTSYNGIQAPISPLSGLAKVLKSYMAGKEQRDLIQEQKALGERAQQESASDIATLFGHMKGQEALPERPPVTALDDQGNFMPNQPAVAARAPGTVDPSILASLRDPQARQIAVSQLVSQMAKEREQQDFERTLRAAQQGQSPVAAPRNPMIPGQAGSSVMAGAAGTTPPVATQETMPQGSRYNLEALVASGNPRAQKLAEFMQKQMPEYGTKGEVFKKSDGSLVERVYGKRGEVIERPLQATPYEPTTTEIRNVNEALIGAGIDRTSPQGRAAFTALLNKMTSHQPPTNVNVNTERSYFGNVAEGLAKSDASTIEAARAAPERVTSARRVLQTLQQNPITGTGAQLRLSLDKALSTAGLIDPSRTQATENLMSSLAAGTLDSIRTSGLGAGQGFTDKDREFLERAKSGNIEINAQTLGDLARLNERAGLASIEKGNQTIKRLKKAPGMSGLQTQLEEIPMPETGATNQPSQGRVKRFNPVTGKIE